MISALEELEKDKMQKSGTQSEARGLISKMTRLETAIMVQFWGTVLPRLESVNKYVQNTDVDVWAVVRILKSLIKFFDELREQFNIYEEKALKVCVKKTYERDEKRQCIRKLQADESRDGEVRFSGRDNVRVNTFLPIIDKLQEQMQKRIVAYEDFAERYAAITKMWTLTNEELENEGKKLLKLFKNDLEPSLIDELLHFRSHILITEMTDKKPLSLNKWLRKNCLQTVYPNVDILLQMYICTPISNASAERSFSCLKRIKKLP